MRAHAVRNCELDLNESKSGTLFVGEVRGKGLLLAVELVADQTTKAWLPLEFAATRRLRVHGFNHRIMLYARGSAGSRYGQWFMVAPPLTITEAEVGEVVDRTDKAVKVLCAEVQLAGVPVGSSR